MSTSVKSERLAYGNGIHSIKQSDNMMLAAYSWVGSVPSWATMILCWEGENPTKSFGLNISIVEHQLRLAMSYYAHIWISFPSPPTSVGSKSELAAHASGLNVLAIRNNIRRYNNLHNSRIEVQLSDSTLREQTEWKVQDYPTARQWGESHCASAVLHQETHAPLQQLKSALPARLKERCDT